MDTVSSLKAGKKIKKKEASIPGRTKGITISFKDCHIVAPQLLDASIKESWTCSKAAEFDFKEKFKRDLHITFFAKINNSNCIAFLDKNNFKYKL